MIKRKCKQCGKEFVLSDSEIKFFNDKNLELPKRCNECRRENKNIKVNNIHSNENININNNYKNENPNNNTNKKTNKKVFRNIIASALVLLVLFLGKLFGITIDFTNVNPNPQNGQIQGTYEFRNDKLLEDHFEKHKNEFNYTSKEEYLQGANDVINSKSSIHKQEGEDGDYIYYNASKNEIVFLSQDGYIRTYFKPSDGMDYYNRQ